MLHSDHGMIFLKILHNNSCLKPRLGVDKSFKVYSILWIVASEIKVRSSFNWNDWDRKMLLSRMILLDFIED